MNSTLYNWYENSRDALASYELEFQNKEPHEMDPQIDEMVRGWQEAIDLIEKSYPHGNDLSSISIL